MKSRLLAATIIAAAVAFLGCGAEAQPLGFPTLSSNCGTGAVLVAGSTPNAGTINAGTGSPTACTLTISSAGYSPWKAALPTCVISASHNSGTPIAAAVTTRTATAITVTVATAMTTGIIDYNCQ